MPERHAGTHPSLLDTLSWEACRLLVDGVTDYAIFMLDLQGRVATWSRGAERMKGYAADEIIGRHFSTFYPEDDIRAGKCEMELEVASREGRFEDEGWRLRKDGTRFWANVVITALRSEAGELVGFAKVTRDLTERKRTEKLTLDLERERAARAASEQAEARVRESEERYRELNERLAIVLEGVADGITVQDRDGRLVYANSAAARLCGFATPEELTSTPPAQVVERFELLGEDGAPIDAAKLPGRRALAGEAPPPMRILVRNRRTNKRWWALVRASAVRRGGEAVLAVTIWHDVTSEHRQHEALLLLSRASGILGASLDYGETLQTLASAIVQQLADGCSIELEDGGRLKRVAVAPASGRADDPRDPETEDAVRTVIRAGRSVMTSSRMIVPIAGRQGVVGAVVFVRAETPQPFDPEDCALAEELGRRAAIAIEHARLFSASQESAHRAEEASRVKDDFLATVSHELRTPLNAILGWATLLRQDPIEGRVAKAMDVIYRNANAQVHIIDDILDVSRIISGKMKLEPRPADVVHIARDALDVVRPAAEARNLHLELVAGEDSIVLVADPDRLQQVMWNLLSNAIKFTEPGGTVSLRVEKRGAEVRIVVVDTGKGIDRAFLAHVFERFRQADSSTTREHSGLGLGLAIVRHIVELHGGRVSAGSEGRGKGSSFEAVLPIRALAPKPASSERPSQPELESDADPAVDVTDLRVLVVDDDADARDVVHTLLTSSGAIVETASSTADAVEALERFQPHVLVSDIGMPHEDGYALIRRVRSRGATLPAIALTAYARRDDRNRALAAGFTTHLAKPVSPHDLLLAVANLATLTRWASNRDA